MFSRQQAAALMDMKGQMDELGVAVVVIGSGTPEQAKAFAGNFNYTGEIFVDQDLRTYNAFELERGFFKTLGPSSLMKGIKALGQGFRQGLNAGDLWQQGGLFVLGPGEKLVFSHVDRFAGDHAEPAAVVQACALP
jgi:hypothetical protein